jgi:hypothetical protein
VAVGRYRDPGRHANTEWEGASAMARLRKRRADLADSRLDGRLPDGDTVPTPGYARWTDLVGKIPTVINTDPPAEATESDPAERNRRRWPWS